MTATRAPLLGITIAALVLLAEGIGLVAYQHHQRSVEAERAAHARAERASEQAVNDAIAARERLGVLMAELDRLDAEIRRLALPGCSAARKERARVLRQLEQLRMEQRQLYDLLNPPEPRRPERYTPDRRR